MDFALCLLIGVLPVIVLLFVLISLDSYKLVHPREVLRAIAMGSLVAGASYLIHLGVMEWTGLEARTLARYVAPVIEEIGKALLIIYLIRAHRLAFIVDAAIYGFAIGTGFAVIENVYYALALSGSHAGIWVVRGFGTAIMHGSTTAIVAIAARLMADRSTGATKDEDRGPRGAFAGSLVIFLPGLAFAIAVHSLFNHFLLNPVLSTAGALVALPPVVFAVFRRSESSLREWLDVGFDADTELLELIHSGELSSTRVGLYLESLKEHFDGVVVADMLCYLRLHVELALCAKGLLMMKENGFKVTLEPDVEARFAELKYLEKTIGLTGRLAMAPFLRSGAREVWQLSMLRQ